MFSTLLCKQSLFLKELTNQRKVVVDLNTSPYTSFLSLTTWYLLRFVFVYSAEILDAAPVNIDETLLSRAYQPVS